MGNGSRLDNRDQDVESPQALGERNLSKTAKVSQYPRRSRRLGIITPHACATCRRKRSKCDGKSPCERCKRENTECVYETTVRRSKEDLRAELDELRQRQLFFERVFAELVRPERWERTLASIRSGSLKESEWLDLQWPSNSSVTLNNLAKPEAASLGLDRITPVESQALDVQGNDEMNRHQRVYSTRLPPLPLNNSHSIAKGPINSMYNSSQSTVIPQASGSYSETGCQSKPCVTEQTSSLDRNWTSITDDNELIQHLLALYFCWEYPSFAPISKEHFLRDFYDMRPRYCSSMLINALLSLACHLSDRPLATIHARNLHSLGDDFFKESHRLFSTEMDHHHLSTIQALAIMSVREARCSRLPESKYYAELGMRLAIEMRLHAITVEEHKDEHAVLSKTFWGTYALDQAWAMMTSTLPRCSYLPLLPPKPAITADVETSSWVPYIDGDTHLLPHIQQSNVRSVYRSLCSLSELVHESQYLLYSPERHLTAATLLKNYHHYLVWYHQLPDVMRLGDNSTPAVLFTHLYYHFAILLLFRRFIKWRLIGSQVSPREVCVQSADAIQSLVISYAKLYTLRRTSSFMPFFIFASATLRLTIDATFIYLDPSRSGTVPRVCKALEQSIASLVEAAPYHPFAKRVLCILRYHACKWNMNMDVDKGKATFGGYNGSAKQGTINLNCCARVESWGGEANAGKGVICDDEAVKVMCNMETLWPVLFWFQDKVSLPSGEKLEQTGFAVLS